METRPPRGTRLLRLSVRALMVVVLVLAVALGYLVNGARVQREAVAAIQRSGGSVRYEWEMKPGGGLNTAGEPKWPRWLVKWLGADYFGHVKLAYLGKQATDAEMEHVARLPRLAAFSATGSRVTDAGAAHLRGLGDLESIRFSETKVTGARLVDLRGHSKLIYLFLNGTRTTDADLANLEGLTSLECLDLSSTPVTDAGLAYLEPLVKLKQLRLNATGVTGPGLAHLRGMRQLAWLYLSKSPVRDLAALPALPALKWLQLNETRVDDAQLTFVSKMSALEIISVRRTGVGDAGLLALQGLQGSVKSLGLSGTRVTDASAATLAGFEKLTTLLLENSAVTDATLDRLAGLKALRTLDVGKTGVTAAGLARLKKALPGLRSPQEGLAAAQARAAAQAAAATKGTKPQP